MSIKTLKNGPQKLLIIVPDPFISQSNPDHSPQPRIDFFIFWNLRTRHLFSYLWADVYSENWMRSNFQVNLINYMRIQKEKECSGYNCRWKSKKYLYSLQLWLYWKGRLKYLNIKDESFSSENDSNSFLWTVEKKNLVQLLYILCFC